MTLFPYKCPCTNFIRFCTMVAFIVRSSTDIGWNLEKAKQIPFKSIFHLQRQRKGLTKITALYFSVNDLSLRADNPCSFGFYVIQYLLYLLPVSIFKHKTTLCYYSLQAEGSFWPNKQGGYNISNSKWDFSLYFAHFLLYYLKNTLFNCSENKTDKKS